MFVCLVISANDGYFFLDIREGNAEEGVERFEDEAELIENVAELLKGDLFIRGVCLYQNLKTTDDVFDLEFLHGMLGLLNQYKGDKFNQFQIRIWDISMKYQHHGKGKGFVTRIVLFVVGCSYLIWTTVCWFFIFERLIGLYPPGWILQLLSAGERSLVKRAYLKLGRMFQMKQSIQGVGQCCITSLTISKSPVSLTSLNPFTIRYSRLCLLQRLICWTTSNPMYVLCQSKICCIISQSPNPIYTILFIYGLSIRCWRYMRYLRPTQASEPGPERGPFLFHILFQQIKLKGVWQSYG